MARMTRITGMDKVLKNLKMSKKKIGGGMSIGLRRAGLFLLRESLKIVPVRLGHLKGSGFIRVFGFGLKTDVIVGYTADYAAYVHENLDAAHGEKFNIKYADKIAHYKGMKSGTAQGGWFKRGKNQQAKFLESPARIHRIKLLRIVRDSVVLKI